MEGGIISQIRFSRGESVKFCDWMEEDGKGKKRGTKIDRSVVVFSARRNIGYRIRNHRLAWTGISGLVQKVPGEKPRAGRNETVVEN